MSGQIPKLILGLGCFTTLIGTDVTFAKVGSCTEPVVFGTTISATGPFSVNADRWVKMTEIFAEEINKRGISSSVAVMVRAFNSSLSSTTIRVLRHCGQFV